jgi:four helix bundle protein
MEHEEMWGVEGGEWGEIEDQEGRFAMASSFKELRVWQNAMDSAMVIFELTKKFPREERFSMTDQVRRSTRSTASNIAEAWRKRRYVAAFISKLSDAEAEAAESQTWIEFALRCGYVDSETAQKLDGRYEEILAQISIMIRDADRWCSPPLPR